MRRGGQTSSVIGTEECAIHGSVFDSAVLIQAQSFPHRHDSLQSEQVATDLVS